jgi:hypothetical protein
MGIKKTNTRMWQTPYAGLMEIIWLQTLNQKSCSTNVVLQNGRNHNHLWKKQDKSLASSPSWGNNQLTKQNMIPCTNAKPNPSEETLRAKKC